MLPCGQTTYPMTQDDIRNAATQAPLAGWLAGTVAGLASMTVLAWRGHAERGRVAAPINAPSHWVWGERALTKNRPSWRYTGLGILIHQAASVMWGMVHERLLRCRRQQATTVADELRDAALVTAAAAAVDLVLIPRRFTPGFERRLSARGTALVYAAFALGLALGSRLAGPHARE